MPRRSHLLNAPFARTTFPLVADNGQVAAAQQNVDSSRVLRRCRRALRKLSASAFVTQLNSEVFFLAESLVTDAREQLTLLSL